MPNLKYVMFNDGLKNIPIIFPDIISHKGIADAFMSSKEGKKCIVVSAGFIDVHVMEVSGCSQSLGIYSRPEDERIIRLYQWCFGINNIHAMDLIEEKLKARRTE